MIVGSPASPLRRNSSPYGKGVSSQQIAPGQKGYILILAKSGVKRRLAIKTSPREAPVTHILWEVALPLGAVDDHSAVSSRRLCRPFQRDPDFGLTSLNYDPDELLVRADAPA